jgi:hypothetical protein
MNTSKLDIISFVNSDNLQKPPVIDPKGIPNPYRELFSDRTFTFFHLGKIALSHSNPDFDSKIAENLLKSAFLPKT